jgi:GntR family transcriptional regulator, arabinose operon transcriptional repressor
VLDYAGFYGIVYIQESLVYTGADNMLQTELSELKHLDDKPKWELIREFICIKIEQGKYRPGDLLPSENFLVKLSGFARNTVRQAVAELEKEGVVEKVKGKGTFVKNINEDSAGLSGKVLSLVFANLYGDFPASIVTGAEAVAGKSGLKTQIYISNDNYDLERRHIRRIIEEGTGGVIVFGVCRKTVNPNCDIFLEVKKRGIPIVMVDTFLPNLDIDHVVSADFEGSFALTSHFIRLGHCSIGYIRPPEDVTSVQARFAGFQKAMSDNNLPVKSRYVFSDEVLSEHNDFCCKKAFSALDNFIKGLGSDLPTAFLCYTDAMAISLYRVLHERGYSVPTNIEIGGFGGGDGSSAMSLMPLSTVIQPKYELGEKAAELIIEKLERQESSDSARHILLPTKLNVRSTESAL